MCSSQMESINAGAVLVVYGKGDPAPPHSFQSTQAAAESDRHQFKWFPSERQPSLVIMLWAIMKRLISRLWKAMAILIGGDTEHASA